MEIRKEIDKDTLTIIISGWIDTLTAPVFHDEVQDLDAAKNVILDFSEVEYISSAGLSEVVALFRRVVSDGGEFLIRDVSRSVMDVFSLTGFDKKINITVKQ